MDTVLCLKLRQFDNQPVVDVVLVELLSVDDVTVDVVDIWFVVDDVMGVVVFLVKDKGGSLGYGSSFRIHKYININ